VNFGLFVGLGFGLGGVWALVCRGWVFRVVSVPIWCGLISGWAWVDLGLPARGDFARGGLRFLPQCRSGLISAWVDLSVGVGLRSRRGLISAFQHGVIL
jgi:hypothetical protein